MSLMITNENALVPILGIPIVIGLVMCTLNGDYMSTCPTGEAPGGRNTLPGTDPNAPGNDDPGLPYGFTSVPSTGTLL